MENRPLVSILCATYNHAPYIRETLEGFLMQEYDFPIEILIHDDASTDGTADIIREYQSNHPDLIFPVLQTENQYSKGRKILGDLLIPQSKGKYLAICEGDDYWLDPYKLNKQIGFLESHPDFGLSFTDVNSYVQKTGITNEAIFKSGNMRLCTTFEDNLIYKGYCAPCSWVLRKELYSNPLSGTEHKSMDGTFPWMLDMFHRMKVHFLDEVTATYRVLSESASHSKDYKKFYKYVKNVFDTQKILADYYKVSDEVKHKIDVVHYCEYFHLIVVVQDKTEIKRGRAILKQEPSIPAKARLAILFSRLGAVGALKLKILLAIKNR